VLSCTAAIRMGSSATSCVPPKTCARRRSCCSGTWSRSGRCTRSWSPSHRRSGSYMAITTRTRMLIGRTSGRAGSRIATSMAAWLCCRMGLGSRGSVVSSGEPSGIRICRRSQGSGVRRSTTLRHRDGINGGKDGRENTGHRSIRMNSTGWPICVRMCGSRMKRRDITGTGSGFLTRWRKAWA
jgi:hypothetical protein